MNNHKLRENYYNKEKVIKKLSELLNTSSDETQSESLKKSITMLNGEKNTIAKTMRKNSYSKVSKSTYKSLMKNIGTVSDTKENEDKKVTEYFIADEISYIRKNCDSMSVTELGDKLGKSPKIVECLIKELGIKPSISKDIYRTAKIIFDGSCSYKLYYDNGKKVYTQKIDQKLLDRNYSDSNSIYNFNIIKMLKDFDHANNTNLYSKYMHNELSVVYDFINNINDETIPEKERKKNLRKVEEIAKREEKAFDNIKVMSKKKNKVFRAGLVAVATVGLIFASGLGIGNFSNKSHGSQVNGIESDLPVAPIESNIIEDISVKENITKEEIVTEKEEINKNEKKNDFEISSDDTFVFNDPVDFYYASTDNSPVGSSKKLDGYKYRESSISVVYDGKCIMQVSDGSQINLDELEQKLEEEYNGDVKIFVNFDLLDKETGTEKVTDHVAWVRYEDVKGKGLVLTK